MEDQKKPDRGRLWQTLAWIAVFVITAFVSFYDSTGNYESSIHRPYSEETAAMIDSEVRELVNTCYTNAKKILVDNRKRLLKMAVMLLQKEIIRRDDIEAILGQRPAKYPLKELMSNGKEHKAPLLLNQFNEKA